MRCPWMCNVHFSIFQRQFYIPCVSVEMLGDGYAKGSVHCGGGLWDLELQLGV